jgi:hypothetical protein
VKPGREIEWVAMPEPGEGGGSAAACVAMLLGIARDEAFERLKRIDAKHTARRKTVRAALSERFPALRSVDWVSGITTAPRMLGYCGPFLIEGDRPRSSECRFVVFWDGARYDPAVGRVFPMCTWDRCWDLRVLASLPLVGPEVERGPDANG